MSAIHPPLTREERRSLFLHRAIAERVAADPGATIERARRTVARMRLANPGAARLLSEWEHILYRPVDEILDVLTNPSLEARELRHVTAFAGILTARERAAVYRAFRESEVVNAT